MNVLSDNPVFSLKFENWNVERPPWLSAALSVRICKRPAIDDQLEPVVVALGELRLQAERIGIGSAAVHVAHGEIARQVSFSDQKQHGRRGLVLFGHLADDDLVIRGHVQVDVPSVRQKQLRARETCSPTASCQVF